MSTPFHAPRINAPRTVTAEQYEARRAPWSRIADSLDQYNREHPWNPFGNRRDLPKAS